VHLKLFAEKMVYQREKDQKLYEQGWIAAENARLAIQKQGELVECLSTILNVLHVGLMVSEDYALQYQQASPLDGPQDPGTSDAVSQKKEVGNDFPDPIGTATVSKARLLPRRPGNTTEVPNMSDMSIGIVAKAALTVGIYSSG
jgi:hypothetical protein